MREQFWGFVWLVTNRLFGAQTRRPPTTPPPPAPAGDVSPEWAVYLAFMNSSEVRRAPRSAQVSL